MRFQSCQLLRKQFQELKKVEGLSLRSWSESVGLSPTYISLVFNSKRLPNLETLRQLGQYLEMDKLALTQLKEAYQLDWLKKNNIKATPIKKASKKNEDDIEVTMMDDTDIFKSWLNLALSEFTLCDGFTEDPRELSKLFAAGPEEIKQSFKWLISSGFLVRDENGVLKKKYKKIRFPISHRSRQQMRSFHKQMMLKAIRHMEINTDQEAYSRRLINGYTIALDPNKIEEAKLMLQKSMIEIAHLLSSGEKTSEVYQLQVQFFPLIKR